MRAAVVASHITPAKGLINDHQQQAVIAAEGLSAQAARVNPEALTEERVSVPLQAHEPADLAELEHQWRSAENGGLNTWWRRAYSDCDPVTSHD